MACIGKMNMALTVTNQSGLSGYLKQIDGKTPKSVSQSVTKQVNSLIYQDIFFNMQKVLKRKTKMKSRAQQARLVSEIKSQSEKVSFEKSV